MNPHLIPQRAPSVAALAVLFCLSLGILGCNAAPTPATAWSLIGVDGKTVKLSDFKGKVVVINFWATWCPPCVGELPDLIALQKAYAAKGVAFVGLSIDSIQPKEVAAFAKKAGINYPIVMADDKTAADYGADEGVPTTCLVDRKGQIVYRHLGAIDKQEFEEEIKKALAEKP